MSQRLRSVGGQKPRSAMNCDAAKRYMTNLADRYARNEQAAEDIRFVAHVAQCSDCEREYHQMAATGFVGRRDDEITPEPTAELQ